ncbi:hypothetical protein ACFSKW_12145 [Nonomuraea mangrovi]|uniref:Uncharacterized protein n=1 Tax=Nonomuraea mangrovi TaxID=2316207 RepID=A0ABW4SRL6_9ACTN
MSRSRLLARLLVNFALAIFISLGVLAMLAVAKDAWYGQRGKSLELVVHQMQEPAGWVALWAFGFIGATVGTWLQTPSPYSKEISAGAANDPGERIRRRAEEVNEAFLKAAELMADLSRDMEAQQAVREVLLQQAKEQQRLLEINADEAEKIQRILFSQTEQVQKAERRHQLRQQWMFFALGALISVPIGISINLFVP